MGTAARGVVAVPDGTTAQEQGPGTPEEQINQQVVVSQLGWLTSLFGADLGESGGGGGGGRFMFADLDELDSVIQAWHDEIGALKGDRDQILATRDVINQPAADPMSALQADSARKSLGVMWEHSEQMLKYAESYLAKLHKARVQMAATEDAARTGVRNVYPT